jgi:hypothetical protein
MMIYRSSVEILFDSEYESLIVWYALDFVAPLARNLHGRLHSLCASIHWEDHVETEHFSSVLGEAGKDIVVEGATAKRQSRGLLSQRLHELRVAVALVHGAVCGEEVEIVLAFRIPDRAAACSREDCVKSAL